MALTALALVACNHGKGNATPVGHSNDSVAQAPAPATTPDTLTLALVGDIMMGTTYPTTRFAANDGRDIFLGADSVLRAADLACGNLEGALADSGKPRKTLGAKNSFSFMMPTRLVQRLVDAGIDFVNIANNHIYDFWDDGVKSTMRTLDNAGIAYSGNPKCRGVIKQVRGMRVGLCSFGHSRGTLNLNDSALVHSIIDSLHRNADVVVVSFHGGCEGAAACHVPNKMEIAWGEKRGHLRKFAHDCIDWGADVVWGHGPHVARAMESYKGRVIAYSLGNFCTPVGMGLNGVTSYAPLLALRLLPSGEVIDGHIHGFIQQRGVGPRRDHTGTVVREIARLTREDFPSTTLKIAPDGAISIK